MAAISETLRQARLRSGFDLDKLAAKTKINPRYLRAIEAGEFDKLPGGIFARMFIKQYADAVGLDGAAFAEEYQRNAPSGKHSGPDIEAIAHARSSFQPTVHGLSSGGERLRDERLASALSSAIWVVAAILVCAGAYYLLAHLPGRVPEASRPAAGTVAAAPAKPPVRRPEPAPAASVVVPPATPQESADQRPPDEGAGQRPAPQPIQLTIDATDVVWVTAIADGKTMFSESLQPGSSKTVEASKGARITLGNAGGVDITFNGKKLEPFGTKGQVRTVDFTSWGAQVVSRTPPSRDPLL